MSDAQIQNYQSIYFQGKLSTDVKSAIADNDLHIHEVYDRIKQKVLASEYAKDFYRVSHILRINDERTEVYLEHSPYITGTGTAKKDQFENEITEYTTLVRGELSYLRPPDWVHPSICDCGGAGIVGSFVYAD